MASSKPKLTKEQKLLALLPESGKLRDCQACVCRGESKSGPIGGRGNVNGRVLIVGQNPSGSEDYSGKIFVGDSWDRIAGWIQILQLPMNDFWITNAVKCHTKENRKPSAKEIQTCGTLWLRREVSKLPNIRAIITLGGPAKEAVLGRDKEQLGVKITEPSRVDIHDADGRQLAVFPIPHPSYYLRSPEELPYLKQVVLVELRSALIEVGAIDAPAQRTHVETA